MTRKTESRLEGRQGYKQGVYPDRETNSVSQRAAFEELAPQVLFWGYYSYERE